MLVRMLLICAIALGAIAPAVSVDGKKHRRQHRHHRVVVVRDSTPDAWKPYVAQTVTVFNQMLPKRAKRMRYKPIPEAMCEHNRPRRVIAVCVDPSLAGGLAAAHATPWGLWNGSGIVGLRDSRPDDPQWPPLRVLCHEFMHVTTGIGDDYSRPQRDTSCVHGDLEAPGPFDTAYAQEVYKKDRHR